MSAMGSSIGSRCSAANLEATEEKEFAPTKVHWSFSVKHVVHVLANLRGDLVSLLDHIGFAGLMNLPLEDAGRNSSISRQFSLWLMLRVDTKNSVIDLGPRGRIPLSPKDVHQVFGLPCEGELIESQTNELSDGIVECVRNSLLLGCHEEFDLDSIRKILIKEYPMELSSGHRVSFIMAAVIFIVSCFLAPKGCPRKINTEILPLLVDPISIFRINWCEYVLRVLLESCAKVQEDIRLGSESVVLDGCLLLIQIIYLDNLEFGKYRTKHYKTPRIVDFKYEVLEKLIGLERVCNCPMLVCMYGAHELRHPAESIYTFGDKFNSMVAGLQHSPDDDNQDPNAEQMNLVEFIEHYADEQKKEVRKRMREFANQLCINVDRYRDNLVSAANRWMKIEKRRRSIMISSAETKLKQQISRALDGEGPSSIKRCDVGTSEGIDPSSVKRGRFKKMVSRPSKAVRRAELLAAARNEDITGSKDTQSSHNGNVDGS